jgi:hypothetical protein
MKVFKSFILLSFLALFLCSCSVAVRKSKVDDLHEVIKNGDMSSAIDIVKTTSQNINSLNSLELGQFYRLKKNPQIEDSTLNFFNADNNIESWQKTYSEKLKTNVELLSSYLLTEGFNSEYYPKNYEVSLLSLYLSINHLSQGKWDSAMVEARKMAAREKFIESLIQEKILLLEKANQDKRNGIDFGASINNVESINGYPVLLVKNPEVNKLKNSYQNAAVYYLSAFIYEAMGEPSLSAPGYRLAIELMPTNKLFKESLSNLDSNVSLKANRNNADTLFIIESGFLPKMESLKFGRVFNFGNSPKLLTITYPVIPRITESYRPTNIQVNQNVINLDLVTNVDTMARRELNDEMPAYITRAISRAIAAVGVQALVETAAKSRGGSAGQNATAGILGVILSDAVANSIQSLNTVDARHWQSLPAYISLARSSNVVGNANLQLALPNGAIQTESINLHKGYNVVNVRILRNRAIVTVSKPQIRTIQATN